MKNNHSSFVIYSDYAELIKGCELAEAGEIFMALMAHAEGEEIPEFSSKHVESVFNYIKKQVDRNSDRYKSIVEKRRQAGKKGAEVREARKAEAKNNDAFFCSENHANASSAETNQAVNENENVNENDNANENGNVNENENKNDNVNVVVVNDNNAAFDDEDGSTTTTDIKTYGKNVRLTEQQYSSLCGDYGKAVIGEYIDKLDNYIASNSLKPYANHYATISSWLFKDEVPVIEKPQNSVHLDLDAILQHALLN